VATAGTSETSKNPSSAPRHRKTAEPGKGRERKATPGYRGRRELNPRNGRAAADNGQATAAASPAAASAPIATSAPVAPSMPVAPSTPVAPSFPVTARTAAAAGTPVAAHTASAPVAARTPVAAATAADASVAAAAAMQQPVLPVPPRDSEKYAYVRRHAWVLSLASAATFPPLVLSQIDLAREYSWFWVYLPFVLLGVGLFTVPLLTDGLGRGFDVAAHRALVAAWAPRRYPSVDVFLPVCGEPVDVLRNTWQHVAAMSKHYKGQVTAYVLDDSANPDLKAMAREYGFAYATRPNRGWYKKSGNLLYGYQISSGELILLLDADFAPRHDFLNETVPYMETYPQIGIVQTPQFFRVVDDQTWVERGAGAVQELFYRSIQTARARKGGATCVGSCALYRRAALEDNGGMSVSEHSEDLRTGFDLYRRGWQLCYLPVAVSTGTCPDNVLAFLNQQYRWCSGTVVLFRDRLFWRTRLPLYTRLCYISGFIYYLYTAVYTFFIPALAIAILIFTPSVLQLKNAIFILPILLYGGVIFPLWHRSPYRLEAWSVRIVAGWAHLFAIFDNYRGRPLGWQPSGLGATKQDGKRRFWIGVTLWSWGSAAAWTCLAFWRFTTMDPYNILVMLVLGLFELVIASRILVQPRVGAAAPA